jgi:hypothetical protein
MKQYKLIIMENLSGTISGILQTEKKGGWKLNSYESNRTEAAGQHPEGDRNRVVLVFEK